MFTRKAMMSCRLLLPAVALFFLVTALAVAQDEPTKPAGERAFKGRLPAYFSQVVDTAQRKEIYSIQLRYVQSIERLKEQLKQLTNDRDDEVWNVLSDLQKAEVTSLREAARRRREARAQDPKPASPGPSRPGTRE